MRLPFAKPRALDPEGRPLIGLTLERGEPIFGLPGHTITYGPTGAGKTTSAVLPMLLSLMASEPEKAILISDPKDGEIACQVIEMALLMGRKVALIDDFNVLQQFAHHRVSLNPFGDAVVTQARDPRDLIYANDMITHALIEEPEDRDMKNFWFRESPRMILRFGISAMLKRDTALCTPGAVAQLLADVEMVKTLARIEAEEGDLNLQQVAQDVITLEGSEHYGMHMSEASRALRYFGPGTRLAEAGAEAALSHADLIRQGYLIFLVGPQALMSFAGPYYALHMGAFLQALYQQVGHLRVIADEFTNTPLKKTIDQAITTIRSYNGTLHLIAQSKSEMQRKLGKDLTQTVEDNCTTKRWLAFGNHRDAEEISRAIGEEQALTTSLGNSAGGRSLSTNLSLTKQRRLTASELMSLPRDHQLLHLRGIGFVLCRRVFQNEIAPYGHHLAENPMEGGRLPPDPKVTLTAPAGWPS